LKWRSSCCFGCDSFPHCEGPEARSAGVCELELGRILLAETDVEEDQYGGSSQLHQVVTLGVVG